MSAGFFDVLGADPILGRTFGSEEDQPGHAVSVLLDEGFWHREFEGNPNVLGRRIILDDKPYAIIGVLPAGLRFAYGARTDIWMPLQADRRHRTGGNVLAIAHLKSGVTREVAQAEMTSVMRGIGRDHVEDSNTGVQIKPLREWMIADVRLMVQLLAAFGVCVLLICCANVANLLLARSNARRRELVIRASLGAGKSRLMRHLAAESLILVSAGGAAGAGLAVFLVRLIPAINAFAIPRANEIAVDWRLFAIACATTAVAALVCGIIPAWQAVGGQLADAMRADSSAGKIGGLGKRDILVVGQFALALVLLTGAGMLAKSLWALLTVDTGFERERVITVHAVLPYKKYDQARSTEFYSRLAAEVGRIPGVRKVAAADHPPLQAILFPYEILTEGGSRKIEALGRHVGPGYFEVLGIPVLAGREFQPADEHRTPIAALVNRKLAESLFGDATPLGKRIVSRHRPLKPFEIVGVVGETRQTRLTEAPGPQIYLPASQGFPQCLIAKVAPNAGVLTNSIRRAVLMLDPEVPVPEVSSMEASFDREIAKPRLYTLLLGSFAAIGVLLAALGIYGVTSYAVNRRGHEFGIRMALGAQTGDILRLVLSAGVRLTVAGVLTGLAGAFAITRILASNLYAAKANDTSTVATVLLLLIVVGLAACLLPARRATRVDPAVALRCD